MVQDYNGIDYNEVLHEEITEINRKVRRNMLPLVARMPALEAITEEYASAQANHHEGLDNPPISYRDSNAMDRCADLILHEELTWSHPDKMSIVEFPIMSENQRRERFNEIPSENVYYRKEHFVGNTSSVGEGCHDEVAGTSYQPVYMPESDEVYNGSTASVDAYKAIEGANLTARQRQAIDLVYFGDMTQEEAAKIMGIRRQVMARHVDAGLSKLREYVTKD